jgi:hypothetical protein
VCFRLLVLPALLGISLIAHAQTAHSLDAPATVASAAKVSGPSPLTPGCEGAGPQGRVYRNSVVEPSLAIDPGNPRHLLAAWQQDRWATAGASAQLSAVSWDGGRTWSSSSPVFSRCTGGNATNGADYQLTSDPWVTIAPNGDAYQMTIAFDSPQNPSGQNAMLVGKSVDGGVSWAAPTTLIREAIANGFNDKNSITADPYDPAAVYAIWQRELTAEETPETPDVEEAMFTRTTDGGLTWETPRPILAPAGMSVSGHIVQVLPGGDLVDLFTLNHQAGDTELHDLEAIRSTDRGTTWSRPVAIAPMQTVDLVDPYSTFTIRPTPDNIASTAVDRTTGELYATWTSGQFSGGKYSDIALSSSTDGGVAWTAPVKVNQTQGNTVAFVPTVAVLADGTVGVSYFDLRNNTPTQPSILANHWLATCHQNCGAANASWQEVSVAGPFDLQRAPYAKGFFVGDYMGIVAGGGAFDLLYVTSTPTGNAELTAAYFTTATPP